ncbi:unnamed protein product, partial [Rotaria sordida]
MMNLSVKNRRVDRISILLQEYNIEKVIHIKGQNNCLADYLSRHPIQYGGEIFNEDYGISMLFEGKPLNWVYVPDNKSLFVNAVVTRSKKQQILQQESSYINPLKNNINDRTSLAKGQVSGKLFQSSSCHFTCNDLDIEQTKFEQIKDTIIQ